MSKKLIKGQKLRAKRKARIRAKISGTAERPRLSVYKSARHVYAQVIDDNAGKTIASVSSFGKDSKGSNVEACTELGKTLAERCKAASISQIVFDRNGYQYHGRIKAFAEGVRESGLSF